MPIFRKSEERTEVMEYTERLSAALKEKYYHHRPLKVEIDDRDLGGARGWEWIKKGIPVRVEIGPRDIAADSVMVARRDKNHKKKETIKTDAFVADITGMLDEIQKSLFERALSFRKENTIIIDDNKTFHEYFTPKDPAKPDIHGGFALSCWCGSVDCEARIKEDLAVSIRCMPFEGDFAGQNEIGEGKCICCEKPSNQRVVFAKAY
jgi:prolyl-tRNA synthetase